MLIALAMPNFSTMLQNLKLRGTAESILTGLQIARVEALKRNQTVSFILTSTDPSSSVTSYAPTTDGPNWAVQATTDAGVEFVQGRSAAEGSGQTAGAAPQIVINAVPAGTITFDGLGVTAPASIVTINVTPNVSNPTAGNCIAAGGNVRCLNIVVTPNGSIKMCDPSVPAVGNDTRAC
jgi:type IV fimbrial biogenesis protein FimT